jgi:hypothetical protein
MSTDMEDRLAAALQARAELVQSAELGHPALPEPAAPRWRRPAVVALVAAATVAAVLVPLAFLGHHTSERPLPNNVPLPPDHVPSSRFPAPVPKTTRALSGDVDGDGHPDQIRLVGRTLTVTLAADPGHELTYRSQDFAGLVGLADIGGPGRAVFVSTHDLVEGAELQAIALRQGALQLVLLHEPQGSRSIGVVPGYETSWITPEGVAMTGQLDPMQTGERHLAVKVSRVEGRAGRPVISPVGRWCWDVVMQDVPAPCPAGVDNAFDPGPHGSLPPLLPRTGVADAISPNETWREGSTALHLVESSVHATSSVNQAYNVVGTIDGHPVSAHAGTWQVGLMKRFVDLGHGVRGVATISLDNDNANSGWTWHLLPFVDDRLVSPSVSDTLYPGVSNVVAHGKGHAGETWIGPDGQVFTSVALGDQGYVELFQWQVTDASGRALEAVDLGEVCMDAYWGTYGTCTS